MKATCTISLSKGYGEAVVTATVAEEIVPAVDLDSADDVDRASRELDRIINDATARIHKQLDALSH